MADPQAVDLLRRTIAGFVRNPNVGGAVLIGLGCERNGVDGLIGREHDKAVAVQRRRELATSL